MIVEVWLLITRVTDINKHGLKLNDYFLIFFIYNTGRKYALLKLKVLLSTVLRNYKVVSDVTEDQFALQADIILKRADGFRLKIEPRRRVPSTVASTA